jgi:hypothetical protein
MDLKSGEKYRMKILLKFYYILLTIYYTIKIARQNAINDSLRSEIKKYKKALGKHDFPTSNKSTEYPE